MNDISSSTPPSHAETQKPAGPLFDLGQLYATRGLIAHLETHPGLSVQALVQRHVTGDYGELSESDRQANTDAIARGDRILSAYTVAGEKVYLITEGSDSEEPGRLTTALLASEY